MSSATLVPESRELTGDDAWRLLHDTGEWRLLRDAFRRMRVADGFSHARSLAFLMSLVAIQGLIGLVGLSSMVKSRAFGQTIIATIRKVVPGPAGHLLTSATSQAHHAADAHRLSAVLFALVAGIITATTAMGQVERGLNRIYGDEQDRPTLKKYAVALVAALSAGTLVVVAFTCLAVGSDLFTQTHSTLLSQTWSIVRWPLGFGFLALALTMMFRWLPRRSQPKLSWLAFGAGVAMVLWGLVTTGFGLFFQTSTTFGSTYGPLAGVVALLLWCFFSSLALFYGGAVAAQLEAIRVGVLTPRDTKKVLQCAAGAVGNAEG